jgi:hypothetical protein
MCYKICVHKEIRVILDKEHWCDHIPKLMKMSHEIKVTMLWNQQVKTERTALTLKQTSKFVVFKNESVS